MNEIEKIKSDIVEIKLELRPLERLPDKLDELIRSQQEFIQLLSNNYVSEKNCTERRGNSDEKIKTLEAKVEKIFWTALGALGTSLGFLITFLITQVVFHK